MENSAYTASSHLGSGPEKKYSIEHRTGKAARLASRRKIPQSDEFVGDGCFRVFPMCAHFPRNETLDSLSTLP
jgi:hypothetical protein